MRTTAGPLTLFVLLVALAACVAVSSVQASTGVRYGIQDDAWLEFGPGTLDQRLSDVQAARRAARPLHAALERGRPATAEESDLAARSRLRLASARTGSCAAFAATA